MATDTGLLYTYLSTLVTLITSVLVIIILEFYGPCFRLYFAMPATVYTFPSPLELSESLSPRTF
jgi:hypothetical protein